MGSPESAPRGYNVPSVSFPACGVGLRKITYSSNKRMARPSFLTWADVPEGTPPPSLGHLQKRILEIATEQSQLHDAVGLSTCRSCLASHRWEPSQVQRYEHWLSDLSSYAVDQMAFSEKIYRFQHPKLPEVRVASTLNSDRTLSYWLQYPITPVHLQRAVVQAMGLPLTVSNLQGVEERYPALYHQLLQMHRHELARCESVEPLYVAMALRALAARDYTGERLKVPR